MLLCCVMFLLVTAVWNRLAAVESTIHRPGDPTAFTEFDGAPPLRIALHASSIELSSEAGERISVVRDAELTALRQALQGRATNQNVDIVSDDGLVYAEVIAAMDALIGEGFLRVNLLN